MRKTLLQEHLQQGYIKLGAQTSLPGLPLQKFSQFTELVEAPEADNTF